MPKNLPEHWFHHVALYMLWYPYIERIVASHHMWGATWSHGLVLTTYVTPLFHMPQKATRARRRWWIAETLT